jgi:hypothetical protein
MRMHARGSHKTALEGFIAGRRGLRATRGLIGAPMFPSLAALNGTNVSPHSARAKPSDFSNEGQSSSTNCLRVSRLAPAMHR